MDYERIDKPSFQGGGFSPSKLRALLLGVEKKRKVEEEIESRFDLRPEVGEAEDRPKCKDVDMISSLPECSTSVESGVSSYRSRDQNLGVARVDDSFDSESAASSNFEFHKPAERAPPHRSALMPPFLKPAPSKWDDAQKWIASPNSNRSNKAGGGGLQSNKKLGFVGYGSRQGGAKVVLEVVEEVDTKRIDPIQARKEIGGQKAVRWAPESYPVLDSDVKSGFVGKNLAADSAISLSQHDSSTSAHTATAFIEPPSAVTSVSMRDMGTEMTPIASQEASQTETPVRATTPMRSPTSSRPSTPPRTGPSSTATESVDCHVDSNKKELSETELKMKTRREIMVLGQKLGKMNIAAWASKEEEETDASISLKTVSVDQPTKRVIETRAAAWEEAEKAKYLARFKQEEIKIQAWENHQQAKIEAEMKKIEVEVERMRARAHDRLMSELAASRHKAEEKRAAAEAKRNQQASKTSQQAEYIRRTGRMPSSVSCWGCCS